MATGYFVQTPADRDRALDVVGTKVTVLATPPGTTHYGITVQRGSEGHGPPPHFHEWDEAFFVLSGEVVFTCEGDRHVCGAGTLVHVPARTVHAFNYGPGGGEMLEFTGPGTQAAAMFAAVDALSAGGAEPAVPDILRALRDNGVSVPGAPA